MCKEALWLGIQSACGWVPGGECSLSSEWVSLHPTVNAGSCGLATHLLLIKRPKGGNPSLVSHDLIKTSYAEGRAVTIWWLVLLRHVLLRHLPNYDSRSFGSCKCFLCLSRRKACVVLIGCGKGSSASANLRFQTRIAFTFAFEFWT